MKMYILVKETVPLGFAVVAVAHASLAAYLKFKDTDNVKEWLSGPFYKVVCKVNEKEFNRAKRLQLLSNQEKHGQMNLNILGYISDRMEILHFEQLLCRGIYQQSIIGMICHRGFESFIKFLNRITPTVYF